MIEDYKGKTVVIKYGGNAMKNETLKNAVMEDVAFLTREGVRVVLIHGGGPEINRMLEKTGKESRFIDGLRYTDEETMDIVLMVFAGKVNKELVALLGKNGCRAVGLCGADAGMIYAEKRTDKDLGLVGDIKGIDARVIEDALDAGYVPVIATVGADRDGGMYNINADTAAGAIAGALGAARLVSVTDISGVLRDVNDPDSIIREIDVRDIEGLVSSGVISGGMIPKTDACVYGVRMGVERVSIIDGRREHAILNELSSDSTTGTVFFDGSAAREE